MAIRDLPDERRQLYRHIRRQAAKPEPEPWELPYTIEGEKDGNTKLDGHMYVTTDGKHACTLNEWERDALKTALAEVASSPGFATTPASRGRSRCPTVRTTSRCTRTSLSFVSKAPA